MPPEGVYFQNDVYIYTGDMGGNRSIPLGGRVVADIDATAIVNVPTAIWVTPVEIGTGSLAFSFSAPFGYKEVNAGIEIDRPLRPDISASLGDDIFTFGDPIVSGMVGWHSGNFHWQTGVMVNVPVGDYQNGELANISFNRWGADVFAAATWLEPSTGLDISGAVGVTFNGENPATDYRTGTEFHLEWAISKTFTPQFSAGVIGYYYDQISGDSGAGARLGDFEGRVAAIGATVGYNFELGEHPVATRIKYFHEFAAENRAEGDSVFLTFSVPLSIAKAAH